MKDKSLFFSLNFIYFLSLLTIHLTTKPLIYDFGIFLNFLSFVSIFLYYDLELKKKEEKEKNIS